MSKYTEDDLKKELETKEYEYGFYTDIESETFPVGLDEDIVIAISANCGSAFYFESVVEDVQLTLSHYLAKFKVDTFKLNPRLLVYYLNSKPIKNYFRATETGKTQKNLSKTYLKNLPIFLPTELIKQNELLEQIKLVENKIEQLKNLKSISKNITNKVFGDYFKMTTNTQWSTS